MKSAIQKILGGMGIELRRKPSLNKGEGDVVLHTYLNSDGEFNYDEYRKTQTDGNRRKIDKIWVLESNIEFLSDYVLRNVFEPKFGICHGTRRGKEQEWFRKYLECEVIGTEISDTAREFPNTIQWDFHDLKPEWVGNVDFIYSNALDHSYDPEKCLNAWMKCLRKGGLCIIEHSSLHEPRGATKLDPFGASLYVMPYLIAVWGNGKYGVRQILPAPSKISNVGDLQFLILQNFS